MMMTVVLPATHLEMPRPDGHVSEQELLQAMLQWHVVGWEGAGYGSVEPLHHVCQSNLQDDSISTSHFWETNKHRGPKM